MEIQKKIIFFFIIVFLVDLVYALSPPELPDHFKGNLIIDNGNAPIGTEIKIYVNDELEDTITTTLIGKYDLYVKTGQSNDKIVFKIKDIQAGTYERKGGKTISLDLEVWTDRDGDGINDTEDTLIGENNDLNDNFNNLKVIIDNNENLTGTFLGIKNIELKEGNKKILDFEFDFSTDVLNLFNLEIKKQSNDEGSILVKGMPEDVIKTVYVDKLKTTNAVCIKDEEISSITEINNDCSNGVKVNCPGSNGDYTCSVERNMFKVSGLRHSGVKEFYIAPPSNPPSGGGGGGSSGGGGGGGTPRITTCTENWDCQGWFNCRSDGTQRRICMDKNNCGTALNKPVDLRECETSNEEKSESIEENAEKKLEPIEEKGNQITGAVIGTGNRNLLYGIGALIFVGIALLIVFLTKGGKTKIY